MRGQTEPLKLSAGISGCIPCAYTVIIFVVILKYARFVGHSLSDKSIITGIPVT